MMVLICCCGYASCIFSFISKSLHPIGSCEDVDTSKLYTPESGRGYWLLDIISLGPVFFV